MRSYGRSLAAFTGGRLKIFPAQISSDGNRAAVRTEVMRDNGDRVPVVYTLHKTPDGWKAYDVGIEGISYVKSLREDLAAEIDQKGIDEVIARMLSGGKSASAIPTTGGEKPN